jgi:WD40 repeat protein
VFTLRRRKSVLKSIAFSPDGARLAVTGQEGWVQVWDLQSRSPDREFSTGRHINDGLLFPHPDRLWVERRGRVEVFGARPSALKMAMSVELPLPAPCRYVHKMALSPDSHTFYTTSGPEAFAVSLSPSPAITWRQRLPDHWVASAVGLSANGRVLAVGRSHQGVCLFDAASGREIAVLGQDNNALVSSVALSPDGQTIAWCASTRLRIARGVALIREHLLDRTHFHSAVWHPSGGFFATVNGDGKVDFWDAATGERRQSFDWGVGKLYAVAFDATGDRAACCSQTGDIVVWDVDH